MLYCPDCTTEIDPDVEDNSFDHEFGTEWILDYHCPNCERLLQTRRSKPRKEVGEP